MSGVETTSCALFKVQNSRHTEPIAEEITGLNVRKVRVTAEQGAIYSQGLSEFSVRKVGLTAFGASKHADTKPFMSASEIVIWSRKLILRGGKAIISGGKVIINP